MTDLKLWVQDLLSVNSELVAKNAELEEKIKKLESLNGAAEPVLASEPCKPDDKQPGCSEQRDSRNMCLPQQNPVLILVVLQILMRYVPAKDLAKARLVCKAWDAEAKAQICQRYWFNFKKSNLPAAKNFLVLLPKAFNGFRKLKLDLEECNDHLKHLEIIQNIVSSCCENLTEFWLRFEIPHSVWRVQDVRDKFLVHFSNLQCLYLHTCPARLFEPPTIFPPGGRKIFNHLKKIEIARIIEPAYDEVGWFIDLLRMAPNLETLLLNGKCTKRRILSSFPGAIEALCQVLPDGLKYLSVCGKIENADVTKLINSKLQVDRVTLSSFRRFEITCYTTASPVVLPGALHYGETDGLEMANKLKDIMSTEFTTLKNTGNKVCFQDLLRTFQKTLDEMILP